MNSAFLRCAGALLLACLASAARADLLIYKLAGTGGIVLQGEAQVNAGRTVSFTHPKFGNFYFSLESAEIIEAPSTQDRYKKLKGQANKEKDPKVKAEAIFQAAQFALKRGLIRQFLEAVEETLKFDPQHERTLKVLSLKAEMEVPIDDLAAREKELRDFVKIKNMRIASSAHFILLHDTPPKPAKGSKSRKNRAQERLDLLEQVYHSFLYLFFSRGCPLEVPKERLKVVLFDKNATYDTFSENLSPGLASASGYWLQEENIAVFYDHGTTPWFQALNQLGKELNDEADELIKKKAKGAGEIIRFARTINLLIHADQENADVTVVSHEATHQMAGNTGLLPRDVMVPHWVHEGLATYFEAPGQATWAGIGAVNEERLEWYKGLSSHDRVHSNIDFIIGDQIFDFAGGNFGNLLHGYAQSWALTHFLVENYPEQYVDYCRILGEMPRAVKLSPDVLIKLFVKVFRAQYASMDTEWRSHMDNLKTDVEIIREEHESE